MTEPKLAAPSERHPAIPEAPWGAVAKEVHRRIRAHSLLEPLREAATVDMDGPTTHVHARAISARFGWRGRGEHRWVAEVEGESWWVPRWGPAEEHPVYLANRLAAELLENWRREAAE